MQLKQRHIPCDEGENGSITSPLKKKLVSAITKEGSPHKVEGDSEEIIKALIREGEGTSWEENGRLKRCVE